VAKAAASRNGGSRAERRANLRCAPYQSVRAISSRHKHDSRARFTTSFAPSICFEAIWPGAYNQLVRAGAEFLVNITDDGWFGDTAGPYEHLNAARLRAVETRRWLVRASNSGVSAFVDPTGEIVGSLRLGAVGMVRQRITTSHAVPLYVRWGNWPVPLCALVTVVCFAGALLRKRALGIDGEKDGDA